MYGLGLAHAVINLNTHWIIIYGCGLEQFGELIVILCMRE
jgi:hypothetical protein